jgi:FtsZ-binding cell division protein ZapB
MIKIMQLDQYEKLKLKIKDACDLLINIKLENKRLKKENEQLKRNHNHFPKQVPGEMNEKVKNIAYEKKVLQSKQDVLTSRLTNLLGRIKHLTEGVEF